MKESVEAARDAIIFIMFGKRKKIGASATLSPSVYIFGMMEIISLLQFFSLSQPINKFQKSSDAKSDFLKKTLETPHVFLLLD